ncbi:hypothetical protein DFH09DRAFT_1110967 [Mycena vulgaris]|nr:hypothetical protein DFH09DRAFT_1110967 [Mycena vulgaris]
MLTFAQSLHPTVEVLFIAVHLAQISANTTKASISGEARAVLNQHTLKPVCIKPSGDHGHQLCSCIERKGIRPGSASERIRAALTRLKEEKTESQRRIRATPAEAKIFDLELKRYEGKLKKETGVWDQALIVILHKLWTEHLIMCMM